MKKIELSLHKPGIRSRVMLYLVLFVSLVIVLLWVFQILLLDDFYRWNKTRQVHATSEVIARNLDQEHLGRLIHRLSETNDLCIMLVNENGETLQTSRNTRNCLIHHMSTRDLKWWSSRAPEDGSHLTELFKIRPFLDDQYNSHLFRGPVPPTDQEEQQSLLCVRRVTMPDGSPGFLLLNTIITPLDSTVNTLRSQLLIITFIVLAGALCLAVFISHKFTRPIIETNAAAKSLARSQYTPPPHGQEYQEIAELNATLSFAAQELSQVEHLQHELIANISHDLRTPLTMISGYAEVMRDIPSEATPENLQIIIDESARLTSLVNEIMDFSRLQTGSLPLSPAVFCLRDCLDAVVRRINKLLESDGYLILFEAEDGCFVHADEKRIIQVVYNLLGNALTYTGEDKTVLLRLAIVDQRVRVSIRDSGAGIEPEELPLIWNRYYRSTETHRRSVIGSGLGLSIVRGILEKHEVPFGVESEAGQGTTFWFEVPLATPPADLPDAPHPDD